MGRLVRALPVYGRNSSSLSDFAGYLLLRQLTALKSVKPQLISENQRL